MSEEKESSDRAEERFIVKFNNCGFTHYVGPFSSKETAQHYPAHLHITQPGETVFVEVFELKKPYQPGQVIRVTEG